MALNEPIQHCEWDGYLVELHSRFAQVFGPVNGVTPIVTSILCGNFADILIENGVLSFNDSILGSAVFTGAEKPKNHENPYIIVTQKKGRQVLSFYSGSLVNAEVDAEEDFLLIRITYPQRENTMNKLTIGNYAVAYTNQFAVVAQGGKYQFSYKNHTFVIHENGDIELEGAFVQQTADSCFDGKIYDGKFFIHHSQAGIVYTMEKGNEENVQLIISFY